MNSFLQLRVVKCYGDKLMISSDILELNEIFFKYNEIYAYLHGMHVDLPLYLTEDDLINEKDVIYVPKWLDHLFEDNEIVTISLVNPAAVHDISLIRIRPTSLDFYKMSGDEIIKILTNSEFMSKDMTFPENFHFQITELINTNKTFVTYGRTTNVSFDVQVIVGNRIFTTYSLIKHTNMIQQI